MRFGWLNALRVVAVALLVGIVVAAVASQGEEQISQLGPFPTGDGDNVVLTPRAAP
jgi:hypothetical protein